MTRAMVLTHDEYAPSAIKLGYPVVKNANWIEPNDVVIRWGNSIDLTDGVFELNPAEAIQKATDKAALGDNLRRVAKTPRVYTGQVPLGVKVVARPVEHSRGEGFEVLTGPLECDPDKIYTEFIETDTEFRVWFAGGKTIVAKRSKTPTTPEGDDRCRALWGYTRMEAGDCPKLRELTKMGAIALGLDFGAADVLWHRPTKTYYFLEYNTAPALDLGYIVTFFTMQITALVDAMPTMVEDE